MRARLRQLESVLLRKHPITTTILHTGGNQGTEGWSNSCQQNVDSDEQEEHVSKQH